MYTENISWINENPIALQKIANYLQPRRQNLVCIREIWVYALEFPVGSLPGRTNSNFIAETLRSLGWEVAASKRFPEFGKQRAFSYVGRPQQIFYPSQAATLGINQWQNQPQPPQINVGELKSLAESLLTAAATLQNFINTIK